MSRAEQRRSRAKSSQQRAARKAQRRRSRKAGSGSVAAATAVALGLAGTPAGHATSPAAQGDSAELLVDARPGASGAYPSYLTPFAGAVYFSLDDGVHGAELWRSDGTTSGTVLVKDLDPVGSGYPSELTVAGDTLFFTVEGDTGRALWTSDGTTAGTVEVASLEPSGEGYGFGVVGDTVFFAAADDVHGLELWKSDGTAAGTVMVKDISPGSETSYYGEEYPSISSPDDFVTVGGTLFFTANGGERGTELWRSDGTEAGTVMVKEIVPGDNAHGLSYLTAVGGTVFFGANDGVHGEELWKSDGTEAGTVMVKDINPGSSYGYPNDGAPRGLTEANGTLFFSARSSNGFELWRSDGTSSGTVLVKDINPVADGYYAGDSYPSYFTPVGGSVYFAADDGVHGRELWRTDGTSGGTVLVEDLHPGTYESTGYYSYTYPNSGAPEELTAAGHQLFFTAEDGRGREVWRSDDTVAGTDVVQDIRPGSAGSHPEELTAIPGGRVLFSADDGTHGFELWRVVPGDPQPTVAPSNQFTLPKRGKADTKRGTLTIQVALPGPGTLRLGPSGRSPVKVVSTSVAAGSAAVTIRLTKAGKKRLQKKLQQALDDGKKVGRLKVVTAVTFTPQGGTARTVTQQYTLKLK